MGPVAPAPGVTARLAGGFVAGVAVGFLALAGITLLGGRDEATAQAGPEPTAQTKARFARPTFVPQPGDTPPTPSKIALGKRLFEDQALSSTGTIACVSCHDPKLSFSDGEAKGKGITGKRLVRHTPTLWNVAFSPLLFWDGRAASL